MIQGLRRVLSFSGAFKKLKQATDTENNARNQFLTHLKQIWNEYRDLDEHASRLILGGKKRTRRHKKKRGKKTRGKKTRKL